MKNLPLAHANLYALTLAFGHHNVDESMSDMFDVTL